MNKQFSKSVDISTKSLKLVIRNKEFITFHYENGSMISLSFNSEQVAAEIYDKYRFLDPSIVAINGILVSDVNLFTPEEAS